MALTLDPILATAQDSDNRKPLVEIISDQFTGALPFPGQYFNTDTSPNENHPEMIHHSDESLVFVYIGDVSLYSHKIYLNTSNTAKTMWGLPVEIYSSVNAITKLSLCELDNGNIGVVWAEGTSTRLLRRMVVTKAGTIVNAASTIESWSGTNYFMDSPHVVNLEGSNYTMVYGFGDLNADNGSGEYSIWSRTSADFLTWGADAEFCDGGNPSYYRRDNPFLAIPPSGEYILFYDCVTAQQSDGSYISNIFKSESPDMVTWSSGEAMTNETVYGRKVNTPSADFLSDGTCYLVYTNVIDVLHANYSDWTVSGTMWCWGVDMCQNGFDFDETNRELYLISSYCSGGTKALCVCLRINVDTWEVVEYLTADTVPGFHDVFADTHVWWQNNQQGAPYFSCGSLTGTGFAFVYDTRSQEMRQYNFVANAEWSLTKNVNVDFRGGTGYLKATWMDGDTGRLYLLWGCNTYGILIGYMDSTQDADPITGMYAFHEIVYDVSLRTYAGFGISKFYYIKEAGLFVICLNNTLDQYAVKGQVLVYTIDGSLYKDYFIDDFSDFHLRGAKYATYLDGKLYCSFGYEDGWGQQDRRGLMIIDLATDAITYETPTYEVGIDDYLIYEGTPTDDGRIIFGTGYGLMMYNPVDSTWTEYSNDTVDGFTPDNQNDIFGGVAWDPVNHTLFGGCHGVSGWNGVVAVSELGAWGQTEYTIGTYGADWEFNDPEHATMNIVDTWGSIAVDEEDSWWMVWTRRDTAEQSNKWDNSNSIKNMSDYLVETVEATYQIDQPNELKFSVAYGYLFDPTNMASTWSKYCKRGRIMQLKFGERVDNVNYWQMQSKFVVQSSRLDYARGQDPILNVECSDITELWSEHNITLSTYYSAEEPHDVLADLIEDFALLTSDQYSIPSPFTNAHTIFYQWIDTSLTEALDDLLSHFGYVANVDMDGKWSVKELDMTKATDHTYTNQTKIIRYSPDDSYANYTNKVTVKGEGRYFLEISYPEENLGTISGTMGWWGCKEDKTFYFSDDQQQSCLSPRIDVTEPPDCSFFIKKGGGSISIIYEDPNRKYIVVRIVAPSYVDVLIAAIIAMVAIGITALACDGYAFIYQWKPGTCGLMIMLLSLAIQVICYILGMEANYSCDVYARPVGYQKQTFQSSAYDYDLINELNSLVIESVLDDALCYDMAQCFRVATYELGIVMAQRKRIRFTKIAHLQDEITDIISVVHPYSGLAHRVMIANLTRRYEIPDTPQSDVGFFDDIEGWRLDQI